MGSSLEQTTHGGYCQSATLQPRQRDAPPGDVFLSLVPMASIHRLMIVPEPVAVDLPADLGKVELVAITTGHGM